MKAAELRYYVLGETVAQVVLRRITAEIGERKYGEGWPVKCQDRVGSRHISCHRCRQYVTATRDGLNNGLAFVTNRCPYFADALGKRLIADRSARPDRLDQFVLRQEAIGIIEQKPKQLVGLGTQLDALPADPQIFPRSVQDRCAEEVSQ